MTALDRRLQKIEEALSPTEAVVRWLEEAKRHDSHGAYGQWLEAHPTNNPYVAIPRQVAAWARQDVGKGNDRAATDRIERAVRSAMVRLGLVDWLNRTLANGAPGDANQLDLLQLFAPYVLDGRADAATAVEWMNHAGRLVDEARLWQESARVLGECYYLAGHSLLFPDVERCLSEMQSACLTLLEDYNSAEARPRGRKPRGGPADLALIDAHVAELLEQHVAGILRIVRTETEIHLGERERVLGVGSLIELGEKEW